MQGQAANPERDTSRKARILICMNRTRKLEGGTLLSSRAAKKQPANRVESETKLASASLAHGRKASSRTIRTHKKPAEPSLLGSAGFLCVQRCASRTARPAKLALSGNAGRRQSPLAEKPAAFTATTQPLSVPFWAAERNASVRTPPRQIPVLRMFIPA